MVGRRLFEMACGDDATADDSTRQSKYITDISSVVEENQTPTGQGEGSASCESTTGDKTSNFQNLGD